MTAVLLSSELLAKIAARAPEIDLQNSFCASDVADLSASGYLSAAVPKQFGGSGASLREISDAQRLLAQAAPATALAVNMHQVWITVAATLANRNVQELEWLFADALSGEIFAFGISEPGNDAVLFDSLSTAATAADGDGYLVSGTKIFTTLSPVWSRLGVHAKTAAGKLVFGFIRRVGTTPRTPENGSSGLAQGTVTHPGSWNVLGMRASHSYTTELAAVPLKAADIISEFDPFDYTNPLAGAIFTNFSLLTASVYLGIGERALALGVAALQGKSEQDPQLTSALLTAELQLRAAIAQVEQLCDLSDAGGSRPDIFIALGAAKTAAVAAAQEVVRRAIEATGASAFQADSELARLYRDVLAGIFHPTSTSKLAASMRVAHQLG